MANRGVHVDHATLNHWVVKYFPLIPKQSHCCKSAKNRSCPMDKTDIRIKGKWVYLYGAVDKSGQTLDFMLIEKGDKAAASTFFGQVISNNGWPEKVVLDKSG